MANPITFPSTTARLSLPLLYLGQAQKEPFINHALSKIDGLLAGVVNDSLATAPSDPIDGSAYRVLQSATGDWYGHDHKIALRIGGAWEFITPVSGMMMFDQTAGIRLFYDGSWQSTPEPVEPNGGATVDNEAREAISALIEALRVAGFFVDQA